MSGQDKSPESGHDIIQGMGTGMKKGRIARNRRDDVSHRHSYRKSWNSAKFDWNLAPTATRAVCGVCRWGKRESGRGWRIAVIKKIVITSKREKRAPAKILRCRSAPTHQVVVSRNERTRERESREKGSGSTTQNGGQGRKIGLFLSATGRGRE